MADEAPKTQLQPPSLRIGHAIVPGSVHPEVISDAPAPVKSKSTPAKPHSFSRGNRGMTNATAPSSFQIR